jgi:uncharacterized protein YdhG (YjbR/CyaY superfamily)
MSELSRSAEVDAFLAALPAAQRAALQDLRDALHQLVPDATEAISFGLPTLIYHGPLVGFGATKTECTLHVVRPSLVASLRAAIAPRRASGGNIHFAPSEPLPLEIIERIVRERVHENEVAAFNSNRTQGGRG